ncbi:MAG: hypothetical protein ACLQF0_01330 [Dissulfurispiraceae bacterium]
MIHDIDQICGRDIAALLAYPLRVFVVDDPRVAADVGTPLDILSVDVYPPRKAGARLLVAILFAD